MKVDVVTTSPSALAATQLSKGLAAGTASAPVTPSSPARIDDEVASRAATVTYDFAGRSQAADTRPAAEEASRLLREAGHELSADELERAEGQRGTLLDVLA